MYNTSLVGSSIDGYLAEMQSKCFELTKVVEEFKNKNEEMEEYSNREYKSNREDISDLIRKEEQLYSKISGLNDELSRMNIKEKTHITQRETIFNKAKSKHAEFGKVAKEVKQKEAKFSLNSSSLDDNSHNTDMSFNEANIVLKVTHNEETLQKRRQDLENIKETSAQIAGMAKYMKENVHEQGEVLDQAENRVIEALENVDKAEQEIKDADKISRGNNNKTRWIILIILIGIGIIIGVSVPFWPKKTPK